MRLPWAECSGWGLVGAYCLEVGVRHPSCWGEAAREPAHSFPAAHTCAKTPGSHGQFTTGDPLCCGQGGLLSPRPGFLSHLSASGPAHPPTLLLPGHSSHEVPVMTAAEH